MNDIGLCLEVLSRSCEPLRYIQRWISRKPLEIEPWFQRTTNRKWPMGNRYHLRCFVSFNLFAVNKDILYFVE